MDGGIAGRIPGPVRVETVGLLGRNKLYGRQEGRQGKDKVPYTKLLS